MPFLTAVGAIAVTGIIALLVDAVADGRARSFARLVFAVVAIRAFGVSVSGIVSWTADVWGLLI
jgi:hypothetical protein